MPLCVSLKKLRDDMTVMPFSVLNFINRFFWIAVLWIFVLASALAVVYSVFDSRVKFDALETLRKEHIQLQVAWGQYLLEESTWASYERVEKLATEVLYMKMPEPRQIVLVKLNED